MTGAEHEKEYTPPGWQARDTVMRLAFGQMSTQVLGVAVRLGVFDRVGGVRGRPTVSPALSAPTPGPPSACCARW
ncbi:hypothetical protein ACFQ2B_32780 [Streptomyces stramineus]